MSERNRPEDAAQYITVSDPVQHSEGMNKYTSYRVDVRGGPPIPQHDGASDNNAHSNVFQNPGYSAVLRRFNDFLWLYERLREERAGAIVPPLPEKQPVGRFSAAFIEDRRKNLERFLRRVAVHPELQDTICLNTFLRADDATFSAAKQSNWEVGVSSVQQQQSNNINAQQQQQQHSLSQKKESNKLTQWLTSTSTSIASTVMTVGNADLVRSPDDDLFEEIERYINGLDSQMKVVSQQASALVRKGKEMANGLFEFGLAFSLLGQSEADALGLALQKMGDTADTLSVMTAEHAERESSEFEDPIQDYIRMIKAVKAAVDKRNEKRRHYTNCLNDLSHKQSQANKLKGVPGKEEKSYMADMALLQTQEETERAREDFATVSQRVLREVDRFKREKADDMRATVMDYIQLQIEYNQNMEGVWANLIPQLEQVQIGDPKNTGQGSSTNVDSSVVASSSSGVTGE
eukprot:CAMPEP_0178956640 /NCGR_PEP_ID=MMETSP0789-20121207/10404_1 /TAXON_ID=3005 /ORGANISM="Rhizosolenia setigera, Strain CCMP 1694" /LENGTH=461 /DNA_ID=CAMNT_0020638667 /DNA_START=81 /DNA_END=1466 /DNA_ORIENTATION=+